MAKLQAGGGSHEGSVYLFEVIADPTTFCEIVNSPGNPEIVELFEPKPGQELRFTFLDEDNQPLDAEPVILNVDNPSTQLQKGARFLMDATATTIPGHLAYTCLCQGIEQL